MHGAQVNEPVEGPGETLQAARQAMEISCREVAEALNLPIHTVEAIEANDYERLPAAVFTRGYIRAYAKLLELDPDPVVARYPTRDNETETTQAAAARPLADLIRDHPQWVLGGAVAVALAVLILLAVWLWPASDEAAAVEATNAAKVEPRPPSERQKPVQSPESERSSGSDAATVDPAAASGGATPADEKPAAASETVGEAAGPLASIASETPIADVPAADTPAGVRRITPTGSDRLWFQFSDDCWVEIKSATGADLYSDLSRAGRTLELVGQAPFRILLGYAPGVAMSFNNETVALAPHTRNNVANLVLGQ